jgi:hypothetical protein
MKDYKHRIADIVAHYLKTAPALKEGVTDDCASEIYGACDEL